MHAYLSADIICSMQDTNRAKLEEKCKRETDNVQGQISVRIFAPTRGYCAIIFQIFCKAREKIYLRTAYCLLPGMVSGTTL